MMKRLRTKGNLVTRQLLAALCATALVCAAATTAYAASSSSTKPITPSVTTTLAVFEFNAFFGPPFTQIDCELDHNLRSPGAKPLTEAYCMSITTSLVHNVRLSPAGLVKTCVGSQCGSNPGLGTPDLAPGTRVRSGPFTCVVATGNVSRTVANGRGFSISLTTIKVLVAK
jgi:hypothetical protein